MQNKYYEVFSEITKNAYFLVTNEKVLFHLNDRVIDFNSCVESYFNFYFFKEAYCKEYGEEKYSVKKALTVIKRCMNTVAQTLTQKLMLTDYTVKVFKNVLVEKAIKTSPSVNFSITVLEAFANEVQLKTLKFSELPTYCWGFKSIKDNKNIHVLRDGYINRVEDMSVITHDKFNPFSRYSSYHNASYSYDVRFNTGRSQMYLSDSVITVFIG